MTDQNQLLREALEEIALAGMSGTGQESEEAMNAWHARQAWKFIGIAARALDAHKKALAQTTEGQELVSLCGRVKISGPREDVEHIVRLLPDVDDQPAEGGEPHCYLYDWRGETIVAYYACNVPAGAAAIPLYTTPTASQEQAQQPSTQAWADETGLRQIECPSCGDLAVAYDPQQPSGEVFEKLLSAASLAWEAMEKHRQFKGEAPCGTLGVRAMEELREAMRLAVTFPDAATPKPEPTTLSRMPISDSHMASLIESAIQGHASTREAMRWLVRQLAPKPEPMTDEALWEMWVDSPSDVLAFARRIEAHHGITAQGAQEGV